MYEEYYREPGCRETYLFRFLWINGRFDRAGYPRVGMYQIRIRFEDSVSNLFGFGFDRTSVLIDSDSTETRFLEIRIRPRFVILKCGKIRQNNDVCTSADAFFKLTPSCICIYIREKIEMNLLERVRKNKDH